MAEIKNGKVMITRKGQEFALSMDEISLAHKFFVMQWMARTAEEDFDVSGEESREVAEKAFDLYSEGNGLTEYECVQNAAEKYQDQFEKIENVRVGDHIIGIIDPYDPEKREHELFVLKTEKDPSCVSMDNPEGIKLYCEDLTYGDHRLFSLRTVEPYHFIRIMKSPTPAFFFTFGSNPEFPHQKGYLIVRANTLDEAISAFREKYPDRIPGSNTVNCSFFYTEQEWINAKCNNCCHEIINAEKDPKIQNKTEEDVIPEIPDKTEENTVSKADLGLEISKMLTISTLHVSQDTIYLLDEAVSGQNVELSEELIVYDKSGYGFFVSTLSLSMKNMPADLHEVLKFAEDNGCNWLCLDADGMIVSELTKYERC